MPVCSVAPCIRTFLNILFGVRLISLVGPVENGVVIVEGLVQNESMSQSTAKKLTNREALPISRLAQASYDLSIFDSLVDGVIVIDSEKHFLYANPSIFQMFEIKSQRSIKNKNLAAFLGFEPAFLPADMSEITEAMPYRELLVTSTTGPQLRVQVTARPLPGTEPSWILFLHDVTLEERLQKKYMDQLRGKEESIKMLDRKLFETSLMFELAQGMNFFRELKDILNLILMKLEDAFAFSHSVVGIVDREESLVIPVIGRRDGERIDVPTQTEEAWVKEFYLKALAQGVPQFFPAGTRPDIEKFVRRALNVDFANFLFVPLLHKEDAGFVVLADTKNKWLVGDDDMSLLFGIANQLMLAIDNHNLFQESMLDTLTGLYNLRYFQDRLRHDFKKAQQSNGKIGVLMIDVDHFKKFNDTHGHATGDVVLQQVAQTIKRTARDSDTSARYGGEEFVVILPDADAQATFNAGERIRKRIEALDLKVGTTVLHVTASLGAASFPEMGTSHTELVKLADEALYMAKNDGRNKTKIYNLDKKK